MSYLEMALKVSRERQSTERAEPENQSALNTSKWPEAKAQPMTEPLQSENRAACGSPYCAGCYEVEPDVWIHPPKCGSGWVQ